MKNVVKVLAMVLVLMLATHLIVSNKSFDSLVEATSRGLTLYEIDVDYDDDNKTAEVYQQVDYVNTYDTSLEEVCFHLYPNFFSEASTTRVVSALNEDSAYPNGKSYGKIEIEKLMLNNKEVEILIEGVDNDILVINLEKDLYPTDSIEIEMEYSLTIPNLHHRFGYGDNSINLGNFYPIACVYENGGFVKDPYHSNGDPFYSELANYEVSLKCDNDIKIANTGKVVESQQKDEKIIYNCEAKAVRDFAVVLSEYFSCITEMVGETEVKYYYYKDFSPQKSLETSVKALKTFNEIIGEYPYRTLSVVETGFVHGGMEYPNLVYISDGLDNYEDYTNTIVHEIAHQWWYGVVGNNEYKHGWLDEGLTEYHTALFYEKNPEYDVNIDTLISNAINSYVLFVDVYVDVFGNVDTSMDRSLNEYQTEPEYVYMAYVKGMLLFDNLREVLGEEMFLKCVKDYYKTNRMTNTTPANLIASFEKVSRRNLEGFFNSWIKGTVIIENLK